MANPPKFFGNIDLSGAVFRETDLSRARMYGVLLTGADIDGDISGLVVNGVEIAPLVEAELDRRHPERIALRATTPEGLRVAVNVHVALWTDAIEQARALPDADRHRSVNDEWSFTQTLRHVIFVIDAWFGNAVLGRADAFHPIGLPASFGIDGAAFGIDPHADPDFEEVVRVHAQRVDGLRRFLADVTQDELDRVRDTNPAGAWPPPGNRTAVECLHVVFRDAWAHHQFALRDLAVITVSNAST